MKAIITTMFLISALATGSAMAGGESVDADQLKYDLLAKAAKQKGMKPCLAIKNYTDKSSCMSAALAEVNKRYPRRGTQQYAEMRYSRQTESEARATLVGLRKSYEAAPAGSYSGINEPGVVDQRQLRFEASWIQKNVLNNTQLSPERLTDDPWWIPCGSNDDDLSKRVRKVNRFVKLCRITASDMAGGAQ